MIEEKPWFKFYPKDTPREAIIPEIRLDELLKQIAQELPNRIFLSFMGAKFTFRYVDELVDRFATALADIGVKKGSVVAIMLPNCPQFAIAYYGALRAGAIVTTLNPLYTAREAEFQLNDSGSEILIVLDILYANIIKNIKNNISTRKIIITNIADFLPPLKRIIGKLLRKIPQAKVEVDPNLYSLMDLIKKYKPNPPKVEVDVKNDAAVLLYTGGTTGTPKGAVLTHYNMVANAIQCNLWSGAKKGTEILIGVLPWYHVYGQTVVLNSAAAMGGTVIVYPRFDVEDVMKGIQKNKATLFPAIATIYNAINNHPNVKKYSLSSLRAGISGAGPLPSSVQEKFEKLTGALICEGYGLTEAAPVTHCNPLDPKLRKIGSIGVPLPSTDAGIMHIEKNEFLKPGEEGEIVVSGPQVMKEYWRRPEETRKTLITINGKIWLRTGDIGRMDENGFFYVVDRKKELIKYKGWSVYPREIEEVLFMHEAVKDAAVIGIPDPSVGEWIKAYVVLKDEYKGRVAANDLIEWCRKNLAPYKIPKEIEFKDQLPRTIVGKLLRRLLRDEEIAKRKTTIQSS
jgi:long-chain acyl-CoA synthetase